MTRRLVDPKARPSSRVGGLDVCGWCAGQDVVRLKIGDPFLFGRGGEEILQFRQYGVEPKVRPDTRHAPSRGLATD